ncbi:MAG TPA: hypothetical protein VFA43_05955 [Gemmatimonadaceae bacterium]|nr:hypothetical protein [Gemmatimonadaceae bacterium]
MNFALRETMTQPMDHVTPPHLELLDAPAVRPFEEALTDARRRWNEEVQRHREVEIQRIIARD